MGRHIPEEVLEEIRRRADLAEVAGSFVSLKRRGHDYWACCPFHREKTPSFKINAQNQIYYCFGCKKSGSVFTFVQEMVNTDFIGAVEWLGHRLGIVIPEAGEHDGDSGEAARRRKLRDEGYRLLQETSNRYADILYHRPEAEVARAYLRSRGLDQEAIERFRVGYALESWDDLIRWSEQQGYSREALLATGLVSSREESPERIYDRFRHRLMFPICDELGRVVGFSGRVLESDPKAAKYVNSPESDFFQKGSLLYGQHLARTVWKRSGYALVCEGQMDVIACHRAGLDFTVAAQGTAFTARHAELLKRSVGRVILAFDGDTAGSKATLRTIEVLHQADLQVGVVSLPADEDPDSIFRHGGAEALRQMLSVWEEAVPFVFRVSCQEHDLALPAGKSVIVQQVLQAIVAIRDPVARTAHGQWLAQQINQPEAIVLDLLGGLLRRQQQSAARSAAFGGVMGHAPATPASASPSSTSLSPPPFELPGLMGSDGATGILPFLLDLVLHYDFLAQRLASSDLHALLPETSLGRALTLVQAMAAQDEWELAVSEIRQGDLLQDPEVARCLAESRFSALNPDSLPPGSERELARARLLRAYEDCENRLRLADLGRALQETRNRIVQDPGNTGLLTEYKELLKRQSQLQALCNRAS